MLGANLAMGQATSLPSMPTSRTPSSLGEGPGEARRPEEPQRPQAVSPYWQQGNDSPSAEIRQIPSAAAAAVEARWVFNQTLVDLSNATRLLQTQIEQTPEFAKALREEKSAYDSLAEARRSSLASLLNNPAYAGSEQLRQNLSQQIVEAFEVDQPDTVRIEAMAKLKMEYGRENRAIEQSVLERDQAYLSARTQYLTAATAVRDLRQKQSMAVATDENLIAIRRQIAEARIAKLASAAFLNSAVRARDYALNYAEFYVQYDRRRYYAPYGYAPIYGRGGAYGQGY